jgi:hypothetical protein
MRAQAPPPVAPCVDEYTPPPAESKAAGVLHLQGAAVTQSADAAQQKKSPLDAARIARSDRGRFDRLMSNKPWLASAGAPHSEPADTPELAASAPGRPKLDSIGHQKLEALLTKNVPMKQALKQALAEQEERTASKLPDIETMRQKRLARLMPQRAAVQQQAPEETAGNAAGMQASQPWMESSTTRFNPPSAYADDARPADSQKPAAVREAVRQAWAQPADTHAQTLSTPAPAAVPAQQQEEAAPAEKPWQFGDAVPLAGNLNTALHDAFLRSSIFTDAKTGQPSLSPADQHVLRDLLNPLSKQKTFDGFTPEALRKEPAKKREFEQVHASLTAIQTHVRHELAQPLQTIEQTGYQELPKGDEKNRLISEFRQQNTERIELRSLCKQVDGLIGGEAGSDGVRERAGILDNLNDIDTAAKKGFTSQDLALRSRLKAEFSDAGHLSDSKHGLLKNILEGADIRQLSKDVAPRQDGVKDLHETVGWLYDFARQKLAAPIDIRRTKIPKMAEGTEKDEATAHFKFDMSCRESYRQLAQKAETGLQYTRSAK